MGRLSLEWRILEGRDYPLLWWALVEEDETETIEN
jgi:hypothetical protein